MKPFYADYTNHMMRFYIRHREDKPEFKTAVDEANWNACEEVFNSLSPEEQYVIQSLYSQCGMMQDAARCVCEDQGLTPGFVWQLIGDVSAKTARARGLM